MGTRILYFCFPTRYHSQPMSGVQVCYMQEGPTSKQPQLPLVVDEKAVLKKNTCAYLLGTLRKGKGCSWTGVSWCM
jgi:hypothetical protein